MRALSGHIPGKSAEKWTHLPAEWTHLGRTGGKGGHISAKTEHISPRTEHIEPKSEHIGRKTEHIWPKTEHLAENTVNTYPGRGMPASQTIAASKRHSERRHPRPDRPGLDARNHLVYNRPSPIARPSELPVHMALAYLPYLLLCLLSRLILHAPAPCRGLAGPCPRPRTSIHRPILPSTRSAPAHAAATPAFRPPPLAPNTREFAPKNPPKLSLASPNPLRGFGLARDSSPFIPHRAPRPSSPHPGRDPRNPPNHRWHGQVRCGHHAHQ